MADPVCGNCHWARPHALPHKIICGGGPPDSHPVADPKTGKITGVVTTRGSNDKNEPGCFFHKFAVLRPNQNEETAKLIGKINGPPFNPRR